MKKSVQIKEKAHELGFELAGITPALPVPDFDRFRWWLDQGYAGLMGYMRRGMERRGDPGKILPGVKSVICVGMNYFTEGPPSPVARYAWGEDYHEVLGKRLKVLEEFIQKIDPEARTKAYVDTGAILERSYASQSGLGWIGKNTCLINDGVGSYVFLGEILTTFALEESEYDRPALDQCGTCSKCLDACPTNALPEPYVLDANRCISYLTIEYRENFSPEQSKMVGEHVYGCDICQEVCPYNDRIQPTALPEFQQRQVLAQTWAPEFKNLAEEGFSKMIQGSAMDRIKFKQWVRNCRSSLSKKN